MQAERCFRGAGQKELKVACLAQDVRRVENKVTNGWVMRGNLPTTVKAIPILDTHSYSFFF